MQADDLANLQEVVGSSDATLLVRACTVGVQLQYLPWGICVGKPGTVACRGRFLQG